MPRLREIASFYRRLNHFIEQQGGEITPEQEEELKADKETIDAKVDALRVLMKEAFYKAEPYREEIKELSNIVRAYDRAAETYRRLIVDGMKEAGLTEAGKWVPMTLSSKGRPRIDWEEGKPIPDELKRVKVELDKEKAFQAYRQGFEYDGLIVTPTDTLRAKHRGSKKGADDGIED